MKIFGRQMNLSDFGYGCFYVLVILDVFLITVSLIFQIPSGIVLDIQNFDLIVCIILLCEYGMNLYLSPSKRDFILDPVNILGLIASIPFDFILRSFVPGSNLFNYLRLLKLVSILLLSSRVQSIKNILNKTGMHKVLGWFIVTVMLFTGLLYFFGPSFGWIDDFYFVIVTLTTVGYGDVTPTTHNQKVLAMILILIGMALVSTITAVISSFLTDRILENEADEILEAIEEKSEKIMDELKTVKKENNALKNEISELKELINNKWQ